MEKNLYESIWRLFNGLLKILFWDWLLELFFGEGPIAWIKRRIKKIFN